jgi:hypothetical protein
MFAEPRFGPEPEPMDQESQHQRLGEISTLWGLIAEAAGDTPEAVNAAQQALLERYGGAVRRYLLGALRDPEAADELFQEFALRFVRGDFFHNASPQRGRFRQFVKTSLFNLVVDYQRGQRRRRRSVETVRANKERYAQAEARAPASSGRCIPTSHHPTGGSQFLVGDVSSPR